MDQKYKIGIVGGGICGIALALALQKFGIPCTVLEKDTLFSARNQGYGLTLQQGGKALKFLGILEDIRAKSTSSYSHFIFDHLGNCVVFWGIPQSSAKIEKHAFYNANRNLHISRQNLRSVLLDAIDPKLVDIQWGVDIDHIQSNKSSLSVIAKNGRKYAFDCVAGCDGIFSKTRKFFNLGPADDLVYLGMFVMLGIFESRPFPLYDQRVVQVSDGHTRIFMMPFDSSNTMWQLSFSIESIDDAIALSKASTGLLLKEAINRCRLFASPIPEMLASTSPHLTTGYPVFDRAPYDLSLLESTSPVTLLGDAAHPMSPFKGQGANQALLDAVNLAQIINNAILTKTFSSQISYQLCQFEKEMFTRTRNKVLSSRECITLLHNPDFISTKGQLDRRGFNEKNNPFLERNLALMRNNGIGISTPIDLLDAFSFRNYG